MTTPTTGLNMLLPSPTITSNSSLSEPIYFDKVMIAYLLNNEGH